MHDWLKKSSRFTNNERGIRGLVRQGHDCSSKGNCRDGIEIREMAKEEVNGGKNHDPISCVDWLAVFAERFMCLFQ